MPTETELPAVIAEQLAAFERLQPEFAASFQYVQEVQGQRRFPTFPIEATVYYLHALWICDCNDRFLRVPQLRKRYEGQRCLELLERWQAGETAGVVAFLQHKLEPVPFADITRQMDQHQHQEGERALLERLHQGRLILLNRGMNLLHALEPIVTLPPQRVLADVQEACGAYGQQPQQITQHLAEFTTYRRAVAQRNRRLMGWLGRQVTAQAANQPGQRSSRVAWPKMPEQAYAEVVIAGYVALPSRISALLRRRSAPSVPLEKAFVPVFPSDPEGRERITHDTRRCASALRAPWAKPSIGQAPIPSWS